MTDQQTIDWLQTRLTSVENTTLSQIRFMAQMTIERSNLEADNKRLRGEIDRLRHHLEVMIETAEDRMPAERPSIPHDYEPYDRDLADIASARAELERKDEK